jgi:hypothetical protein
MIELSEWLSYYYYSYYMLSTVKVASFCLEVVVVRLEWFVLRHNFYYTLLGG